MTATVKLSNDWEMAVARDKGENFQKDVVIDSAPSDQIHCSSSEIDFPRPRRDSILEPVDINRAPERLLSLPPVATLSISPTTYTFMETKAAGTDYSAPKSPDPAFSMKRKFNDDTTPLDSTEPKRKSVRLDDRSKDPQPATSYEPGDIQAARRSSVTRRSPATSRKVTLHVSPEPKPSTSRAVAKSHAPLPIASSSSLPPVKPTPKSAKPIHKTPEQRRAILEAEPYIIEGSIREYQVGCALCGRPDVALERRTGAGPYYPHNWTKHRDNCLLKVKAGTMNPDGKSYWQQQAEKDKRKAQAEAKARQPKPPPRAPVKSRAAPARVTTRRGRVSPNTSTSPGSSSSRSSALFSYASETDSSLTSLSSEEPDDGLLPNLGLVTSICGGKLPSWIMEEHADMLPVRLLYATRSPAAESLPPALRRAWKAAKASPYQMAIPPTDA